MRLSVFASGSKGNSLAVQTASTTLLVDLGLSCRQLESRMRACGVAPGLVDAVLFTHDHIDHCSALEVFHRRHPGTALLANDATACAIARRTGVDDGWTAFETNTVFDVGDITVESFSVPHDAADPVGYLFTGGGETLFVATDFGTVTESVRQAFRRADAAVIESNHDPVLLATSGRPAALKQRISGRSGHLSNDDAVQLLRDARPPRLNALFLAHLSAECNTPELALRLAREAAAGLGLAGLRIAALAQDVPLGPVPCVARADGGAR